jgi:hypothetical protein
MQVDGGLPIGVRQGDVVVRSLTANIGHVHVLFTSFLEGRIFSRCIAANITSARGTLHCRKTRICCGISL